VISSQSFGTSNKNGRDYDPRYLDAVLCLAVGQFPFLQVLPSFTSGTVLRWDLHLLELLPLCSLGRLERGKRRNERTTERTNERTNKHGGFRPKTYFFFTSALHLHSIPNLPRMLHFRICYRLTYTTPHCSLGTPNFVISVNIIIQQSFLGIF